MSTPDTHPLGSVPSGASAHCLDDASYILGSLSPADRQTFEQHLATCAKCQASVARLAGLPGLLALTSAAELEREPLPVPETLLPRLLSAVAHDRRRRRWIWTGTVAAAAACVIALVITIVIRPNPAPAQALPAPIAMQQVIPSPMSVSLQLVDKQWGTSIVVNCKYGSSHDVNDWYRLVVYDSSGRSGLAGSWKSVVGSGSTVTAASWVRLKQISRIEVQLPDGEAVLSAVPQHS